MVSCRICDGGLHCYSDSKGKEKRYRRVGLFIIKELMEQTINFLVKGHLTITAIKDGDREILYDDHNALLPNYKNVIRRSLSGEAGAELDRIAAFKVGGQLANAPISNVEYIPLTDNEVKYTALFSIGSFNDTLDEVRLYSQGSGDFSQVQGLSILKDGQTSLQVDWTLKIINQP